MNWVELIGYVASALVAVSFMMKSLVRLRWVSLIGSVIFALYGVLIGAWPVVITNSIVVIANAVRLRKEFGAGSVKVHIANLDGIRRTFTIDELLPAGFALHD